MGAGILEAKVDLTEIKRAPEIWGPLHFVSILICAARLHRHPTNCRLHHPHCAAHRRHRHHSSSRTVAAKAPALPCARRRRYRYSDPRARRTGAPASTRVAETHCAGKAAPRPGELRCAARAAPRALERRCAARCAARNPRSEDRGSWPSRSPDDHPRTGAGSRSPAYHPAGRGCRRSRGCSPADARGEPRSSSIRSAARRPAEGERRRWRCRPEYRNPGGRYGPHSGWQRFPGRPAFADPPPGASATNCRRSRRIFRSAA